MDIETHELIAAYALDALDDADHSRVDELLATSAEAREELRSFAEVSAALAVGVCGPAPRPDLRERILAGARAEPQNVVPFERHASKRSLAPVLGTATAIAAAVAIGLGIWGVSLAGKLDDTRSALQRERTASTILGDPTARTVSLSSGSGKLVVDPAGRAVLVVEGLAPAPAGKTYEVWIMHGVEPSAAGTFVSGGKRNVVPVAGTVDADSVVAVTVEEAGGVDAPTSAPVVASQPV